MNIGIIGAGHIGSTAAKLFINAGHRVAISNSRGPETLTKTVQELGPNAQAMTAEDAARFGEVVLEAIPYGHYRDLPAKALANKILISASNYYPQRDGSVDLGGRAQTELVAEHLPDSRIVKAFNTIYWEHLRDQGDTSKPVDARRVIFLAGDDAGAKDVVADLIKVIGFGPLDTGSLRESNVQEPGSEIYNKTMTVGEAGVVLGRNGV